MPYPVAAARGKGSPAPFAPSPTDTTLQLWLDANDPTTRYQSSGGSLATANAAPVGLWRDKSSFARHVEQATAGKIPTLRTSVQNGRDIVRFDGGDVLANATPIVVAGGQYTIYLVYRGLDVSAGGGAFQNGEVNNGLGVGFGQAGGSQATPGDSLSGAMQGVRWVPTGLTHNTLGVLAATYDGTGATGDTAFRRDGVDGTSASGAKLNDATNGTFIGAVSSASLFMTGDLCEFLLYSTKHDAATILRFEAYLRTKWGMP